MPESTLDKSIRIEWEESMALTRVLWKSIETNFSLID